MTSWNLHDVDRSTDRAAAPAAGGDAARRGADRRAPDREDQPDAPAVSGTRLRHPRPAERGRAGRARPRHLSRTPPAPGGHRRGAVRARSLPPSEGGRRSRARAIRRLPADRVAAARPDEVGLGFPGGPRRRHRARAALVRRGEGRASASHRRAVRGAGRLSGAVREPGDRGRGLLPLVRGDLSGTGISGSSSRSRTCGTSSAFCGPRRCVPHSCSTAPTSRATPASAARPPAPGCRRWRLRTSSCCSSPGSRTGPGRS